MTATPLSYFLLRGAGDSYSRRFHAKKGKLDYLRLIDCGTVAEREKRALPSPRPPFHCPILLPSLPAPRPSLHRRRLFLLLLLLRPPPLWLSVIAFERGGNGGAEENLLPPPSLGRLRRLRHCSTECPIHLPKKSSFSSSSSLSPHLFFFPPLSPLPNES